MRILIDKETSPPVSNVIDSWERSLDPWHPDAFPDEFRGIMQRERAKEPRKAGWLALDWCGNPIGFVADGEIYDF